MYIYLFFLHAYTLEHIIISHSTNIIIIPATYSPEHIKIRFLIHFWLQRKPEADGIYLFGTNSENCVEKPVIHYLQTDI